MKRKANIQDLFTTEELLRSAADYSPEREPTVNMIANAMERCNRRPKHLCAIPYRKAIGFAFAVGSLTLVCVFVNMTDSQENPAEKSMTWPINGVNSAYAPAAVLRATVNSTAEPGMDARADRAAVTKRARCIKKSCALPFIRTSMPNKSHIASLSAPKVKWRDERVDKYSSGVMAPGYLAQPDEHGSTVTITPVVFNIPIQSNEETTGETHISPASYSEERR